MVPLRILLLPFLLFTFAFTGKLKNFDAEHKYSVSELQEDFRFMRERMEEKNPNLYVYTPKQRMNFVFDSLYNGITSSMTDLEFLRYTSCLNPVVRDGHTFTWLSGERRKYFENGGAAFIPLQLVALGDKLYSLRSYSADSTVPDGSEILSVNGTTSARLIHQLLAVLPRDGNIQTGERYMLNAHFREVYATFIGQPASFALTFRDPGGAEKQATLQAFPNDTIDKYNTLKYDRLRKTPKEKAILWTIDSASSTAVLTVHTFDKPTLENYYRQNFRLSIDRAMKSINEKNCGNLILDVRGNTGGTPDFALYLLSWVMDSDFVYAEHVYRVKHFSRNGSLREFKKFWRRGLGIGVNKPKRNCFKGNLYVLMNGGCFSACSDFCACIRYYHRGLIVGEESGGTAALSGGHLVRNSTRLPHTHLQFSCSDMRSVNPHTGDNDGRGVLPDDPVTYQLKDILAGRDLEMEKTKRLINGRSN